MKRLSKKDNSLFYTVDMSQQDQLQVWMNNEDDKEKYYRLRAALIRMRRREREYNYQLSLIKYNEEPFGGIL